MTVRVDLVAPPMSGHLHPVLGLARGLASDPRLEVRVISTRGAQVDIAASGVDGVSVLPGADALIAAITRPAAAVRADPRALLRQFRAAVDLQVAFHAELLRLWGDRPPGLAIVDFTVPAAGAAAVAVGSRWWTAHPSPCVIESPDGPPPYLGGLRPGHGVLGHARDAVGRAAVRGFKHTAFGLNARPLRALGFRGAYRSDGTEAAYSPDRVLALFPAGLDLPRTLPPSVVVAGPVLHTPARGVADPPPPDGRRRVLVTAGTELTRVTTDLVDAAGRLARLRPDLDVHVSLGGGPLTTAAPPGVTVLPWLDYARHLPGYDLVAHHGGAGVLGHTLAAGLPAVVTPVDYDQFDHATRLVRAGVAVRSRGLGRLPETVARAVDTPSLRRRAEVVGAAIRARPAEEVVRELVVTALGLDG